MYFDPEGIYQQRKYMKAHITTVNAYIIRLFACLLLAFCLSQAYAQPSASIAVAVSLSTTNKADQAITNFTPTDESSFATTNIVQLFAQALR